MGITPIFSDGIGNSGMRKIFLEPLYQLSKEPLKHKFILIFLFLYKFFFSKGFVKKQSQSTKRIHSEEHILCDANFNNCCFHQP